MSEHIAILIAPKASPEIIQKDFELMIFKSIV